MLSSLLNAQSLNINSKTVSKIAYNLSSWGNLISIILIFSTKDVYICVWQSIRITYKSIILHSRYSKYVLTMNLLWVLSEKYKHIKRAMGKVFLTREYDSFGRVPCGLWKFKFKQMKYYIFYYCSPLVILIPLALFMLRPEVLHLIPHTIYHSFDGFSMTESTFIVWFDIVLFLLMYWLLLRVTKQLIVGRYIRKRDKS